MKRYNEKNNKTWIVYLFGGVLVCSSFIGAFGRNGASILVQASSFTNSINQAEQRKKELEEKNSILSTISMYDELTKLGADVEIGEDYLIINGGKQLTGAGVDSHNDHRIVMAMAVASVGCIGDVVINGCDAVNKSYPHFFEDWSSLYE